MEGHAQRRDHVRRWRSGTCLCDGERRHWHRPPRTETPQQAQEIPIYVHYWIEAINGYASSKKFWVYNCECNKQNYPRLVSRMKAHSELESWRIRDLGVVPMEKISTHRAIYDHLVRETKASNIDLQHTDPARLFAQQTGVTCLASWVAGKTAEYFPEKDEEW